MVGFFLNVWTNEPKKGVMGMLLLSKDTTLERADFTLLLSMFVTPEKERQLFIIFFLSSFCQLLSQQF